MGLRWLCAVLLALPGAWGDCQQPPRFASAEPAEALKDSYAVGDRVRYRCRPGYMLAGGMAPVVVCEVGSRWSQNADFCIGKSCGEPEIPNGKFHSTTDLRFGATVNYTCNNGYRLVGEPTSQCILKGDDVYWNKIPHCEIIPCSPPPGIENGQVMNGHNDFVYGMVATYSCNEGFSLIGDNTIHCTTNNNLDGIWSGPAPECKVVKCENPDVKNGKKVSGFGTKHTYKDTVTFECNPGHVLNGSSVVTCEADSTWKPPLPTCDPSDCQPPPRFASAEPAEALKDSYAVGDRVRYRCRPGYMLAGGMAPVVVCEVGSRWSQNADFCIGKSCGEPEIPNGKFHSTTDLRFGATVNYTCNNGYRLVGEPTSQCILKGDDVYWNKIPHCEIIPCSPPPGIENGQVMNGHNDFVYGVVATYSCNEGFSLIGDNTIHCTTNNNLDGIWSGPAPECKVVKCENPDVKNGKKVSGFGTKHTYKDTVTFECNPGHVLNGSSVVTCEADSTWKPPLPTCDPMLASCGPAPHFPFAELTTAVGDSSPAGTMLRYQCKPGYTEAMGKSSVVTCLSTSTWSADPDFCIRQHCTPPTIENGDVVADEFVFEAVVTFTCHSGYELKGSSSAKCVVSGNGVDWDTAAPYCKKRLPEGVCEEPPTIDNGMHNGTKGTGFVYGSVVAYKCKDGFTLAGAAFLQCTAGKQSQGVWSKPAPECRGGANIIIVGIFPLLLAMLVMNI